MEKLILGSSSPARRALLERLKVPFTVISPDADETPEEGESPESLARRLALKKAKAVARLHPNHVIIGSDQVCCLNNGTVLNKPGGHERAVKQLQLCSGEWVNYHTGMCVLNSTSGEQALICETYKVKFRELSHHEIDRYVELEKPFGCAGSFRSEGLGVALCEKFEGEDPTGLTGLPLIALSQILTRMGIGIL